MAHLSAEIVRLRGVPINRGAGEKRRPRDVNYAVHPSLEAHGRNGAHAMAGAPSRRGTPLRRCQRIWWLRYRMLMPRGPPLPTSGTRCRRAACDGGTVPPAVGETPGWSLRGLGRGRKLRGTDGGGRPEAVPLDEPGRVVDLPERDQCVARLLDGVEGAAPEQVLFQGADEALGAAVALRRSHEGG